MTQWPEFEPGMFRRKSSDLPIDLETLLMVGGVIFRLIMMQILYLFKNKRALNDIISGNSVLNKVLSV